MLIKTFILIIILNLLTDLQVMLNLPMDLDPQIISVDNAEFVEDG